MTKVDDIITQIEVREGGAKVTNDPADPGWRTQWGISERSNPEAWKDGVVTEAEARAIYERKYVHGPGFSKVVDVALMAQLVDYGVNSGPAIAIQKVQEILHLDVDGILGPLSLKAINEADARSLNNKLVAARVRMIARIVQKRPEQLKYLYGLVDRALDFMVQTDRI
mgnify:CR=1 FL=1